MCENMYAIYSPTMYFRGSAFNSFQPHSSSSHASSICIDVRYVFILLIVYAEDVTYREISGATLRADTSLELFSVRLCTLHKIEHIISSSLYCMLSTTELALCSMISQGYIMTFITLTLTRVHYDFYAGAL